MLILGQENTIGGGNIIQNIDVDGFKIWNLSLNWPKFSVKNFSRNIWIENNKYKNAFSDGFSPISYYLRGGSISFNLTIRWDTQKEFMDLLDELRDELFEENQIFYFEINGVKRKVIVKCTWNPLDFNHYNLTFLQTSITLEYDDFILDVWNKNVVYPWQTENFIVNLDNDWTQRTEIDLIYVFWSWTTLTKIEVVEIDWNNTFSITDNLVDGDVLEINHTKKKITKNWQVIDFDGELLWLENEGARFDFNFTGNVNCDVFILNAIKYR